MQNTKDIRDSFGDPIGAPGHETRWFNTAPDVKLSADRRVIWACPIPACEGEMQFTGFIWPTGEPGYHHKCSVCGFTAAIKGAVFGNIEKF